MNWPLSWSSTTCLSELLCSKCCRRPCTSGQVEQIYQADVLESSRVVSNQEATLPGSLERRGRGWLRVNWKDEIKGFAELLAWGPGRQSWELGWGRLPWQGRPLLAQPENPCKDNNQLRLSGDGEKLGRRARILPTKSDQIDQGQMVASPRL